MKCNTHGICPKLILRHPTQATMASHGHVLALFELCVVGLR